MEEISQENQENLVLEQATVEKPKVRRIRKMIPNQEKGSEANVIKEKAVTSDAIVDAVPETEAKPSSMAVIKENNDNKMIKLKELLK